MLNGRCQTLETLRDQPSVGRKLLQTNFEGLTVRGRYDWFDNVSRDDYRLNIKWGKNFNENRTNISLFADYYHRDRVGSQDDPKWADSDMRRLLPEDSPWASGTSFRNDSIDSLRYPWASSKLWSKV